MNLYNEGGLKMNYPKGRDYSFLIIIVFGLLGSVIFFVSQNTNWVYYPIQVPATNKGPSEKFEYPNIICDIPELMGAKTENIELNNLIGNIKKDLGWEQAEITVLVGSYRFCELPNATLIPGLIDGNYIILFDDMFYKKLNPQTFLTVVAHEIGHLNYQIDADNVAIKYLGPDVVIEMLNTIHTTDAMKNRVDYKTRLKNAKKHKKALQNK